MENQANYRETKLLKLLNLLWQETGEQHPSNINRIYAKLGEKHGEGRPSGMSPWEKIPWRFHASLLFLF